ncbi:MAG: hypothetical protein AAFQ87_21240, partial [Bacteroidota bacterium]
MNRFLLISPALILVTIIWFNIERVSEYFEPAIVKIPIMSLGTLILLMVTAKIQKKFFSQKEHDGSKLSFSLFRAFALAACFGLNMSVFFHVFRDHSWPVALIGGGLTGVFFGL